MRELYWNYYTQIKMDEYYYSTYLVSTSKIEFWINFFILTISFAGIAFWSIWSSLWVLWAIILAIFQIVSVTKHILPFSKRISALNYLLPDLARLANEVERDWGRIELHELSDSEINELIFSYRNTSDKLMEKYARSDLLPENNAYAKRAEAKRVAYFKQKYNIIPIENVEEVYM